jgi:hypothetical protein
MSVWMYTDTWPPNNPGKSGNRLPVRLYDNSMFRITDPATRDLVRGCIPAALVLAAVAAALVTALWWWLSK